LNFIRNGNTNNNNSIKIILYDNELYFNKKSNCCGDTFRPMQGVLATILYDQVYQ